MAGWRSTTTIARTPFARRRWERRTFCLWAIRKLDNAARSSTRSWAAAGDTELTLTNISATSLNACPGRRPPKSKPSHPQRGPKPGAPADHSAPESHPQLRHLPGQAHGTSQDAYRQATGREVGHRDGDRHDGTSLSCAWTGPVELLPQQHSQCGKPADARTNRSVEPGPSAVWLSPCDGAAAPRGSRGQRQASATGASAGRTASQPEATKAAAVGPFDGRAAAGDAR